MTDDWEIGADELATLLNISRRMATKAIALMLGGSPYRGRVLPVAVRRGLGRGGKAYFVRVADLPPEWLANQASPPASVPSGDTAPTAVATVSSARALPVARPASDDSATGNWKIDAAMAVIGAGPKGSPERAEKVRELAAVLRYQSEAARPGRRSKGGKKVGRPVPAETIRKWVADYEAKGLAAFVKGERRADAGERRTIAWRAWDALMDRHGIPQDRQRQIEDGFRRLLLGLYRSGVPNRAKAAELLFPKAAEALAGLGIDLPRAEREAVAMPALSYTGRPELLRARHVARMKRDAGTFNTRNLYRQRFHNAGLRPSEIVMGDVRIEDVQYRRAGGETATARTVVFFDFVTHRVFGRFFALERGEGTRREHVLLTIRDMFADPAWGVPQRLILDNGSEFKIGAAANEIMSLGAFVRRVNDFDMDVPATVDVREVVREATGIALATPYQPQTKGPLEGVFSILTRAIEPMMLGYIGGDRTRKKTANLGREPEVCEGGAAEAEAAFHRKIAFYNSTPQKRGRIRGMSPNDAFARLCGPAEAPEWGAVVMNPNEIEAVFGTDVTRRVSKQVIRHGNADYYAPELSEREGETVTVRVPFTANPALLGVLADKGDGFLCFAKRQELAARESPETAKEIGRRRAEGRRRTMATAADADAVNIPDLMEAALAARPAAPPPAPIATISVAGPASGRIQELRPSGPAKPDAKRAAEVGRLELASVLEERMRRAG